MYLQEGYNEGFGCFNYDYHYFYSFYSYLEQES